MSDRRAEFAHRFPGAIILPYDGAWPEIDHSAFVAPGAVVVGNVTVAEIELFCPVRRLSHCPRGQNQRQSGTH